jgi:hypothetical protein
MHSDRSKTAFGGARGEPAEEPNVAPPSNMAIRNWKLVGNNAVHAVCAAARWCRRLIWFLFGRCAREFTAVEGRAVVIETFFRRSTVLVTSSRSLLRFGRISELLYTLPTGHFQNLQSVFKSNFANRNSDTQLDSRIEESQFLPNRNATALRSTS